MNSPGRLVCAVAGLIALMAFGSSALAVFEGRPNGVPYEDVSFHPTCRLAASLSENELTFFVTRMEADPGAIAKYFLARIHWCREPSTINDQIASTAWQELLEEMKDSADTEETDLAEMISTIRVWIKEAYQAPAGY